MRLRAGLPPVTRLSRKVLLGLGAVTAVGIGGALLSAFQPQHHGTGTELFNTSNRNPPDGLANLPRNYADLARPEREGCVIFVGPNIVWCGTKTAVSASIDRIPGPR